MHGQIPIDVTSTGGYDWHVRKIEQHDIETRGRNSGRWDMGYWLDLVGNDGSLI